MYDLILMFVCLLLVFVPVIAVHEFGHYIVARWCGVPALKFSIGFGRHLCGFTDKRGTYWCLSLIPMGGYVRFYDDKDEAVTAGNQRSFDQETPFKRALIAAAGPVFNFIFAIVLLSGMLLLSGRQDIDAPAPVRVESVVQNSVAMQVGLRANDVILKADAAPMTSVGVFIDRIQTQWPQTLLIERSGANITVALPVATQTKMLLGVHPAVPITSVGVFEAVGEAARISVHIVGQTLNYLYEMIRGITAPDQLAGPIGMANHSAIAYTDGTLILFMALISLSLGVTNALPLPLLDGGHIVLAIYQGVTRRGIGQTFMRAWQYAGLMLFLFVVGFTTVLDVANLVKVG